MNIPLNTILYISKENRNEKQDIQIHTDMSQEFEEDYAPFLMLRRLFKKYLTENGIDMPEKEQELELIKTWAIVQGLSSIACMSNVQITLPWEEIAIRGIGKTKKKCLQLISINLY